MKNEKIRVLHVLGKFDIGGTETLVMNIYKKINKELFQFDFVVHGNEIGKYEKDILKMGGKIYRVPKYKIFNNYAYKKSWKKLLDSHPEYQIIHGHVRSTAAIYLKIAHKRGLKTICHSHSTSNGKKISSLVKWFLQLRIRFISDYFLGCSKKANEWLFGKKISNSRKCMILNNGIEIEKFKYSEENKKKIRRKLNLKENDIVIGHIGRFVDVKNQEFIINIFEKLIKENKNYKLVLCGDGPNKIKIQEMVKEKRLNEKIIFVPSNQEINKYYSAFNLFVLPSKYEGLGIVLIEAQASGLPCISSNNVPKEVKINKNLYFMELNYDKWINKILNLNLSDSRTINEENFKSYDINNTTKRIEKIYIKILKE